MPLPRFRWRWLLVALLAWVVYLVAVPFFAWSKVDKIDAFPAGQRPADQTGHQLPPRRQRLAQGAHRRAAQAARTPATPPASAPTRSCWSTPGSGPTLTMSIPRDSLVPIPGHGTTKINAAFAYGGPKLLVRTIEQNTGIHIDHYVEIGLGGFVEHRRLGRRHHDLPDAHHERQAGQPPREEGLPARRRHRRPRLRPLAARRPAARRHRPRRPAARGHGGRRPQGALAVDGHQPVPLLEPLDLHDRQPDRRQGHERGGHGPLRLGDDPQRPDLPGPDQQPGGRPGTPRAPSGCSS